jgi:hypothetical protein
LPLHKIQTEILRLLASRRDPESYVAGGTPLNRDAGRFSNDIDIFHDREERVVSAALADAKALALAGYSVTWLRQLPAIYSAEIGDPEERTRLEWVVDSDFRFFPTRPDDLFGYVLHPVDLALNKAMAAAGRRAVRDLVDLAAIHEAILPVGALVWAAVEKSPGFTPEGLIAEIRRNSQYPASDWRALRSSASIDPKEMTQRLRSILDEAEAFVSKMPSKLAGLLFLEDGKPVQPDPDRLDDYTTHAGRRSGHWPSSGEIASAMLDSYQRQIGQNSDSAEDADR